VLAPSSTNAFRALDYTKEAGIARLTAGLSPAALSLALSDWLVLIII
jgi:polyhydroxyalkanoate synthase